jgi:uncharacterized delta-60 repeat protein
MKRRRRDLTWLLAGIVAAASVLAGVAGAAPAESATGQGAFGADGIARESLGSHYEETAFTQIQARADGGIVAQRKGQVDNYLANGAPDPSVPPVVEQREVFPAAGGRSFVLREVKVDNYLTLLEPDGTPDRAFGGGTVKVSYGVQAVAELSSGRILVVSTFFGGTNVPEASVSSELLNPDGSAVKGVGHRWSLPPQSSGSRVVREVTAAGNGGVLVVGGNFLIELTADGTPNKAFGTDGIVEAGHVISGARVLGDGSVEAVGWAPGLASGYGADLVVGRFSATGAPETAFGPEGRRHFDFGGEERSEVASWAPDGSVIVGGGTEPDHPCPAEECSEEPFLAAFDPEGGVDTSCGQGGILKLAALAGAAGPGYLPAGVLTLARRPDGSIVAGGTAGPELTTAFLAAVSPRGELLPSFGEGGIVRARDAVPARETFEGLEPVAGGGLIAGGTAELGTTDQAVVVRYDADGSLDRSFGEGAGYVVVAADREATGFAVGGGEAVTAFWEYPRVKLVMNQVADGAPVTSFGSAGGVVLPRGVRANALGVVGGDPVVLSARRAHGQTEPATILRYGPDGKPDPGFGHGGRLRLRLPGSGPTGEWDLAAAPGGRTLVGGSVGGHFAVARLKPNGRLDRGFGSKGWSVVAAGGAVEGLTLRRASSHIYLAGIAPRPRRLIVMRLDADGRLDRSFGHRGRLSTPAGEGAEVGSIVAARGGAVVTLDGGPRPLVRFERGGKVRREWPGAHPQNLDNLLATSSAGHLILGWATYGRSGSGDGYFLRKTALRR